MNNGSKKKLTLMALTLMTVTSVYGFNNIPISFYLMGYGAIPWYILSAVTFFLPYVFMIAEFGAAFKDEKGGMYIWMGKSVNYKYAFIVTFMWYASWIVWMTEICASIFVNISNIIFGTDKTQYLHLFGLNSTQIIGLLAMLLIILFTYGASKGLTWVSKAASVGGASILAISVIFVLGSIVTWIANGGRLLQPITSLGSFVTSPNPSYLSAVSVLGFVVFALFAYGGAEALGGVVDQTENAEKTFPKSMVLSAITIAVLYSLGIFAVGIFTNWSRYLSPDSVNMVNVRYLIMNVFGYQLALSLGASKSLAIIIGDWSARIIALSVFLSLVGAFFTLIYAPLRLLIEGTPAELWPGKIAEPNDKGVPVYAMWIQCLVVFVILFLISFGGTAAKTFYARLVLMMNVASTLPYVFLCLAYPFFKSNKNIKKPFVIFKSRTSVIIATTVTVLTLLVANFFTIIQPTLSGDIESSLWMVAGPIFFSVVAWLLFRRYENRKPMITEEKEIE